MSEFKPNVNALRNQALLFATIAHGNQVRKGNEHIPYIFHPVDVANEVIYYSGLPIPEMEIASIIAILHDTVEDTAVTVENIHEQFGKAIADGVAALCKCDTVLERDEHSKLQQLKESLGRIKTSPRYVQVVKLADRVSNLKVFPSMWGRTKISNYLDEAALIAHELVGASEGLHARLVSRIAEARVMLLLLS